MSTAASDTDSRQRPWVFVLGFASLIAAGVVGYLTGSSPSKPDRVLVPEATPRSPAEYGRDIADLQAELRGLREDLQHSVSVRDVRTPAHPTNVNDATLLAAIERLELSVARLEGSKSRSPIRADDPALVARLGQELDRLSHEPPPGDDPSDVLIEWINARTDDLTSQHLLWTIDDVLAAYGRPTSAEGSQGEVVLHYDVRPWDPKRFVELQFTTSSSRVMYATVTWHPPGR